MSRTNEIVIEVIDGRVEAVRTSFGYNLDVIVVDWDSLELEQIAELIKRGILKQTSVASEDSENNWEVDHKQYPFTVYS